MMKAELERLAGRTVTQKQYDALEVLYLETNLTKQEFVKAVRKMLVAIPVVPVPVKVVTVRVDDEAGWEWSWETRAWMTEVVDAQVIFNGPTLDGRTVVKLIPGTQRMAPVTDSLPKCLVTIREGAA